MSISVSMLAKPVLFKPRKNAGLGSVLAGYSSYGSSTTAIQVNSEIAGIHEGDIEADSQTPEYYGAAGDGLKDDTKALRKCFAASLNVRLTGIYLVSDSISIRTGQRIYSENAKITFQTTTGKTLSAYNASSWQISGKLTITGSGNKSGTAIALGIVGGKNIDISGLTILNISGTGILFTQGIYLQRGNCALMNNVVVSDSWMGIQTLERSEYHSFVNVNIVGCTYGVDIRSGNISWTGGNIVDNRYGLFVGGAFGTNNSHGIFTGVNINHNKVYNLYCDFVEYGQTFTGCHFFGEKSNNIIIKNSNAVAFNGGIIDGRVEIGDTTGFQYLHGVELGPSFNLTMHKEKAILVNCFTIKDGIYPGNTR